MNGFPKYAVGLYERESQLFIIKTWRGRFRDLNHHALANEYRVNAVLHRKIRELGLGHEIRVPQVHGYLSDKRSLSIIIEYVDGKCLEYSPLQEKQDYLGRLLAALDIISGHLSASEKAEFTTRSAWLYCATLPAVAWFFLRDNPSYLRPVMKWLAHSGRGLLALRRAPLALAHRDLMPENVIVKDGVPYLIDSERMVLTLPFYDLIYLSVHPHTRALAQNHQRWLQAAQSSLRPYVFMHAAVDMGRNIERQAAEKVHIVGSPPAS
jgi:aminoglycoside phosphotransferase (APT) family kinase protein